MSEVSFIPGYTTSTSGLDLPDPVRGQFYTLIYNQYPELDLLDPVRGQFYTLIYNQYPELDLPDPVRGQFYTWIYNQYFRVRFTRSCQRLVLYLDIQPVLQGQIYQILSGVSFIPGYTTSKCTQSLEVGLLEPLIFQFENCESRMKHNA